MSIWVVDASPLIFLAKLDRLDLVRNMGGDIYIPNAVMEETQIMGDDASVKIRKASKTWLKIKKVENSELVSLLLANLDRGEAEVIALAKELKADVLLLDDLDARRFAIRVGFQIFGTLGILLRAYLQGEIPSVKNEIEELKKHDFRISNLLTEKILKAAGEI